MHAFSNLQIRLCADSTPAMSKWPPGACTGSPSTLPPASVLVSSVTRDVFDGSETRLRGARAPRVESFSGARPVFALIRVASPRSVSGRRRSCTGGLPEGSCHLRGATRHSPDKAAELQLVVMNNQRRPLRGTSRRSLVAHHGPSEWWSWSDQATCCKPPSTRCLELRPVARRRQHQPSPP